MHNWWRWGSETENAATRQPAVYHDAAGKAPRYWGYGLFMLILYILTGSAWYAMPGTVCLTLSVVCRSGQAEEARL